MPLFSTFFLVFSLFNCAIPLSGNFTGEFLCLAGGFQYSPILTLIAMSGIVLSAAYSIN
ncbi:NADH dehydrogenase subunit 4 (mitochondrion) [Neolecta irregularis DAH-3]|uniref:NADH dehydrogenase subunit 4 n=1 Tax=Neolecta irregularis (strain DAH-3) TaxID=1198029 RepID=A0A1U7LG48_NEOID|nr:NADH dehydrogenase subunit 4 [Neolecta irregularis DAH-3]|eukprot:OLL21619.1 NADH dehydrogenase subunit 4 (mitochondrion) [Neolecta irregularis DAH-3]